MKKYGILFIIACAIFLSGAILTSTEATTGDELTDGCPILEILKAHPYQPLIEMEELGKGIKSISACTKICVICADACIGEKDPMLTRCIRLNQDCADICETTVKILSRQTETGVDILCAQLKACALACRDCGMECKKHAEKYEHCRICADYCFECEEACKKLLEELEEL